MIITRTPYRISFFGGGTDYREWYQEHGGKILSTSINHYCYLSCRYYPPFFSHKYRISWAMTEEVEDPVNIQHPVVRAVLQHLHIEPGMEIHYQGDLPARSGLGSSSAFTVGLLHGMYALLGKVVSKQTLAEEALHIERECLKETVGVQDQIATAYGGFNRITIAANGTFQVEPMTLPLERLQALQSHMLLFFTGVSRHASKVAAEQVKSLNQKAKELHTMASMVDIAVNILADGNDLLEFGRLLHETWQLKKGLASGIAPSFVDEIYEKARRAGALGGKLLGAGGGGFMLFFAEPALHHQIRAALSDLLYIPFQFEYEGSKIIYYDQYQHQRQQLIQEQLVQQVQMAVGQ